MHVTTMEIWILVQLFIDLVLIVMMILFFRSARNTSGSVEFDNREIRDAMDAVDSLIQATHESAATFEILIQEKQDIIRRLNLKLDDRIRQLQQLLDEAETRMAGMSRISGPAGTPPPESYDAKNDILRLAGQGLSAKEIAARLDLPAGEVELVLNLRRS